MVESNYCDDCGRLKKVACTCGMTFAEKIKTVNNQWATWSVSAGRNDNK